MRAHTCKVKVLTLKLAQMPDFWANLPLILHFVYASNEGYGETARMPCVDPDSFIKGGPTLSDNCFCRLVRGGEIALNAGHHRPNNTKSESLSAHQRTPLKWRFAGGRLMAQH